MKDLLFLAKKANDTLEEAKAIKTELENAGLEIVQYKENLDGRTILEDYMHIKYEKDGNVNDIKYPLISKDGKIDIREKLYQYHWPIVMEEIESLWCKMLAVTQSIDDLLNKKEIYISSQNQLLEVASEYCEIREQFVELAHVIKDTCVSNDDVVMAYTFREHTRMEVRSICGKKLSEAYKEIIQREMNQLHARMIGISSLVFNVKEMITLPDETKQPLAKSISDLQEVVGRYKEVSRVQAVK